MSNIDELTGLPQLPPGQYWEVQRKVEYTSGKFTLYGKGLTVLLRQELHLDETPAKKHWWSKQPETVTRRDSRALASADAHGTAPIAVLNAANRIMNNRAKDAKLNALVGIYPPKKLEV